MATVSLDTSLRVGEEVVSRDVDGEVVIFNLASGIYFGLDHVGARIWHLIEKRGELSAVLDVMRQEFDAPDDVLASDLLRLASELLAKGLVATADHGASAG
jgi:hypothetical protein